MANKKPHNSNNIIAGNKKAGRDYEILSRHECGIELRGTEVKSIREGRVNISDAFARVEKGQLFLYGCDVQPWETAGKWFQHEAKRPRRLLMHKREILKLEIQMAQKGYALPLLRLYWKNGRVKAELGVGRGKTHRDQRYDLKERAEMREVQREVSRFNKGRW
ncbi:MAG TPA: SsrA-binding protein SmpB [Candidatus Akkermansia intestinigallinarum]|uniref:SsrA-binding protein n=1 Tax=Candidatus Akkermansia intestinigallinarum TaxID=2838431 RepID=A0A9D2AHL3_9BACT|nr:SsrA-binding protein SmpB [Candidatus Akkermansia intestinigallinarum]